MVKKCMCADAIVVNGDKTLLVKHKSLGIWIFPGGHVKRGEMPDSAAIREAKEETGLNVRLINCTKEKFRGKFKSRPLPMLVGESITKYPDRTHMHYSLKFLAKPIGRSSRARMDPKESTDIRWFTEKEIRSSKELDQNIRRQLLYGIAIAKIYD